MKMKCSIVQTRSMLLTEVDSYVSVKTLALFLKGWS